MRRFILYHDKRHPRDMGAPEVEAFLTYLARQGGVASSTQNQALSAILFLYRQALGVEPLRYEIARIRIIHAGDIGAGFGEVWLPYALAWKYSSAGRKLGWQYIFPRSYSHCLKVIESSGGVLLSDSVNAIE